MADTPRRYWIETLGCPKNQVDSDKLTGTLHADGLERADRPEDADVVVVNTCAFIDEARQESVDVILGLDDARKPGSQLVVTGCLAERYQGELEAELPDVAVAPFGVPVSIGPTRSAPSVGSAREGGSRPVPSFDLLELPRPPATAPWAYVKVAEGCDRNCGFCAIPSFRGKQRSRSIESILAEVEALGAAEVVLVAQDLAAFGRDQGVGERRIVPLVRAVAERVARVRLLYLYPSDLNESLIDVIGETGVPYFDLSLQHVSPPLMRRMRRWGSGPVFAERIADIRRNLPDAAFRSNFIVGYPGETEADHDALLDFVSSVRLDWCGFFAYSEEEGTYGAGLEPKVPAGLIAERLAELRTLQDEITVEKRDELIGTDTTVLVDRPGVARSHREAPEIDGIIEVPDTLTVGGFHPVTITGAFGPDLQAKPRNSTASAADGVVGGSAVGGSGER